MSRADDLRGAQAQSLDALRSDDAAKAMLVELTQASCLLELAKLSMAQLDLSTWARSVVEVIPQFFSVESCKVAVDVEDLPPVAAEYGAAGELDPSAFNLGDGVFEVAGPTSADTFFAAAAQQLAAQLGTMIHAERNRRRAAAADALKIAASLEDLREVESLEHLAAALSALPSAVGAALVVEHRLVGGLVEVESGQPGIERSSLLQLANGSVQVTVRFATEPTPEDEVALTEVLDLLLGSLQRAEEALKLREEAETDALTGCGNRRVAARLLAVGVSRARSTGQPFAAVSFDLDHFKKVNDTLGHPAGDEVLTRFASGLRESVREWDAVCRMGGEEFLVLCPDTDRLAAEGLARRVVDSVTAWCADALPPDWNQTVSAGIAVFPEPADTPDALLRGSDAALYVAKTGGRNGWAVWEGVDQPMTRIGSKGLLATA